MKISSILYFCKSVFDLTDLKMQTPYRFLNVTFLFSIFGSYNK